MSHVTTVMVTFLDADPEDRAEQVNAFLRTNVESQSSTQLKLVDPDLADGDKGIDRPGAREPPQPGSATAPRRAQRERDRHE